MARATKKRRARKAATTKKTTKKRRSSSKGARRVNVQNIRTLTRELRPVVAKNKKLAERLIVDIEKRKARISDDFYQIGVALKALSAPALYQALGYASFRKLLRERRLLNATTAYKLIAVVDQFPKAQARKIGFEKAYALTRFVAATPAEDLASTLVTENPTIGRTPLANMSVRQLEAATARIDRASSRTDDPEAKAARRAARTLQRTLRAAGATSAKVKAVRLEGKWHVRTDMLVQDAEAWA